MNNVLTDGLITASHREQFQEEGFFVLEAVIPPAHLQMLRDECARYLELIHAEMDAKNSDTIGINHRGKRYFVSNRFQESQHLREFLFSPLMAQVCRVTLGDNAFLFFEQYVVKAAEQGMPFGWHQDSGYVGHPNHQPYLTCWCPLDDVTEANGTVYLLPYERAGTRAYVPHTQEAGTNDMIGYRGSDPGVPVICPAGSIAAFSSTVFHRSGPNTTDKMRRVYLPQYSSEPILSHDGTRNWALAEPFLHNSEIVAR